MLILMMLKFHKERKVDQKIIEYNKYTMRNNEK